MCGCSSNFKGGSKAYSMDGIERKLAKYKAKFSAFEGVLASKRPTPIIDTKKHGISDEQYFEYNSKYNANFSNFTDERGFKHSNELSEEFDF